MTILLLHLNKVGNSTPETGELRASGNTGQTRPTLHQCSGLPAASLHFFNMAICADGGRIWQRSIDEDLKNRCVKVSINNRKFLYRRQIKEGLIEQCGTQEGEIEFIYKQDNATEWFVAFASQKAADAVCKLEKVSICDSEVRFENVNRQTLILRIHWLPVWVKDNLLFEYFGKFGKVLSVSNVWSEDSRTKTGMRQVTIVVDDMAKHDIPHTVKFSGGVKILITCPGRLPVCLKCNSLGHVRKDCARISFERSQNRTYAESVRNRDFPSLSSTVNDRERTEAATAAITAVITSRQDSAPQITPASSDQSVTQTPQPVVDTSVPKGDNETNFTLSDNIGNIDWATVVEDSDMEFQNLNNTPPPQKNILKSVPSDNTKKRKVAHRVGDVGDPVTILHPLIGEGGVFHERIESPMSTLSDIGDDPG